MAYAKNGYGQVEPNHLSAQRTAQIYAQLPADSSINVLENGQFVKYDYAAGVVDFGKASTAAAEAAGTGVGEWLMVFNEVKLYDEKWRESYKDFAQKKADAVDGVIVPRVIKTNVGDIFTTNCVKDVSADYVVGDKLTPGATGILEKTSSTTGMLFQVVAAYNSSTHVGCTMADGEPAVKLMRIQ